MLQKRNHFRNSELKDIKDNSLNNETYLEQFEQIQKLTAEKEEKIIELSKELSILKKENLLFYLL